jgi:hypothetical protein
MQRLHLSLEEVERVMRRLQKICNEIEVKLQIQQPSYRMHADFEQIKTQIHDVISSPEVGVAMAQRFFR